MCKISIGYADGAGFLGLRKEVMKVMQQGWITVNRRKRKDHVMCWKRLTRLMGRIECYMDAMMQIMSQYWQYL